MKNYCLEREEQDSLLVWERRVFAVALAWTLPGFIVGAFVGLMLPGEEVRYLCLALSMAVSALVGGLLEADHLI
ncbi:hypothetical protein KIH39_24145 [Telmatocola sphagniphila]|uniref:Uncharacterized protein n=1 Tax=Telmatocola sphagniphila TaxID=1123043 RepID=A0A8E6B5T9_9BACT|nr:hypothetical protein [Telmatocola sphagniphila]QVL31892.1 hypothetical protein KIH39_24145 [Telmatocola sphagniphila]